LRVLGETAAEQAARVLENEPGVERLRRERDVVLFDLSGPRERVPLIHRRVSTPRCPSSPSRSTRRGSRRFFLRVTEGTVRLSAVAR